MPIAILKRLLPTVGFLLLTGITLGLWYTQNETQNQLLVHHMENFAEQFRIRIVGMMNARMASLQMIRSRLVERQPLDFSEERFSGLAAATVSHYPGIAGIYWVSPDGNVQWVFPREEHAQAVGNNVLQHPEIRCREVFTAAIRSSEDLLTPSVSLYTGGLGFYAVLPVRLEGRRLGCLVGVFRARQVMEMSFAPTMLEDYEVSLDEGNQRIYRSGSELRAASTALTVSRDIHFAGKTWRLRLTPNPRQLHLRLPGHLAILAFGVSLSAMLALSLYFLLQRMEMVQRSRDEALREIRERQEAEAALREKEATLQRLLGELATRNAELQSFAHAVSHDLKAPIVTIQGFTRALKEDFGSALTAQADTYLTYMNEAAIKMVRLINDLLELSRIGNVNESRSNVSMQDATHEALASLKPQIEAREIAVHVQTDLPVVWGDRNRLVQVMDNLLTNAAKYIGPDNPSPLIEVGCREEDGAPVFFVRDNGIGIEPEDFERIFHSFERLANGRKVGEGTGMGLAIVKRILEAHGGRIWLESEPGQGATFFFTLPNQEANGQGKGIA